jgi:hypothetical protein
MSICAVIDVHSLLPTGNALNFLLISTLILMVWAIGVRGELQQRRISINSLLLLLAIEALAFAAVLYFWRRH